MDHSFFALHADRSRRSEVQTRAAAARDKQAERKDCPTRKKRSELGCAAHGRTVADATATARAVLLAKQHRAPVVVASSRNPGQLRSYSQYKPDAQASGSSAQWATFLLLSAKDSVIAQTNHSLAHRACTHSLARRAGTESAIHFKYDALPSTIGVTMISGSSYECISWIVVMTAATCFFVVFTEQQCSTDD